MSGTTGSGEPLFVHYFTLDVFTGQRFGGNPLAVILDARGLTSDEMLQVTREFNYSESTFVLPAETDGTTKRVRIFTPGGEVPFAGHPTVGTAIALVFSGDAPLPADGRGTLQVVLGENVGPVPVTVRVPDGVPDWAQLSVAMMPREQPPLDRARVASVLQLDVDDLLPGDTHQPRVTSCGLPFLMVPLVSRDAVSRARIHAERFAAHFHGTDAKMIMVFAAIDDVPGTDLHCRVFCPDDGVPEDPATGSATAALGGFLAARTPRTGTLRWTTQQGVEMGRPSQLEIEVDKSPDGTITAVRVAGRAVLVSEGRLRVR
ncbi:MAG: PhzF family phenazine biosynthesis protein [Gemmatimonadaceae bacterium]|nr:PhzF family phenazine biosynthesis protein [Gemmatimonadaceae bacterium]